MPKRLENVTLYERVYEALKEAILNNEYLPGDVVSIELIARELGVSTTPVREAVARLSAEGLVRQAPNKGVRIAPITRRDVHDVYEVRKILEPYAAGVAAKKATQDPELKRKFLQVKKAAEKVANVLASNSAAPFYKAYLQVDLQLEQLMIEAVENGLLQRLIASVSSDSRRIRSFAEASSNSSAIEMMRTINEEHLCIIDAIIDGNIERAQKSVEKHLDNAERRTITQLEGAIMRHLNASLKEGEEQKRR